LTKFLVTGSAGLVGHRITKDLVQKGETVYSGYHKSKPEFGIPVVMDLGFPEKIKNTIEKINPEVIIHLAALTNVDLCESEKELAMQINAHATDIIAQQAKKQNAFMSYVSTDYVFDGVNGLKKEDDVTNPIDFYGKSKLEGEKAVMNLPSNWCIARISTPYGTHKTKTSFPAWVIKNIQEKNQINVIVDQFTSPTYVANLSRMLIEVINRKINGIIHLSGATRISRFNMAKLIVEKMNLDKNFLKPTNMDKMKWVAKRPKDSSLDISKASSILNEKPFTINSGLDDFINELKS